MDLKPEDVPIRVEKPWGYEIWWAWSERYVGKILHVNAGHKLSVQYHEHKDEANYLLKGRMKLFKGTSADDLVETEISEGHQWHNAPGEVHTIEAIEDSDVLEASTPEVEDVIRLEDSYGRKGVSEG